MYAVAAKRISRSASNVAFADLIEGVALAESTVDGHRLRLRSRRSAWGQILECPATMKAYPLGMVLSARPDMADCSKGGISNWCDFLATAAVLSESDVTRNAN